MSSFLLVFVQESRFKLTPSWKAKNTPFERPPRGTPQFDACSQGCKQHLALHVQLRWPRSNPGTGSRGITSASLGKIGRWEGPRRPPPAPGFSLSSFGASHGARPAPGLGPGYSSPGPGLAHLLRGETPQQRPLHFGARHSRFEKRAPGLQLQTAPTARPYQVRDCRGTRPTAPRKRTRSRSVFKTARRPGTLSRPSATAWLKRGWGVGGACLCGGRGQNSKSGPG